MIYFILCCKWHDAKSKQYLSVNRSEHLFTDKINYSRVQHDDKIYYIYHIV